MRRLYSTFAGGWPGTGLLLLRLVAGSAIIARSSSILWRDPAFNSIVSSAFLIGFGVLLIPGLWTPIAGAFIAVAETWQMITVGGDQSVPLLLGTVGAALAMLGPGLWSIDARLFGWKRVQAPPRKTTSDNF